MSLPREQTSGARATEEERGNKIKMPPTDCVFALELDGVLDFVTVPMQHDKYSDARAEMVRKLDIPMKDPDAEPTTCWTKLQAVLHTHQVAATLVAAVAALWTGARLCGFCLATQAYYAHRRKKKRESTQVPDINVVYMFKVAIFLKWAESTGQALLVVTRNSEENASEFLRMVSSDNRRARIPILSDPSYEYSKPEMIQKWLDEKCQAWCGKHCPQSSLRHTPTRTGTDPKVYLYGVELADECHTRFWNMDRTPAQAKMHYVRVARCGASIDCWKTLKLGLPVPGLFLQRRPLQHLWNHMHGNADTTLPPEMEVLLTD